MNNITKEVKCEAIQKQFVLKQPKCTLGTKQIKI